VLADGRADGAGKMRTPFAPVEARPAQHAAGSFPASRGELAGIDADAGEKFQARLRHQAGFRGEIEKAFTRPARR
jgi:hypothetical protein